MSRDDFRRREMVSGKEINKETRGRRGKIKRERNCVFYSLLCTQYIMSLRRRRVNDLMNWSWE